jgi:hypothetical protein
VAGFEALLLFLAVPFFAAGLAIVLGWSAYADHRDRQALPVSASQAAARFWVFPAVVATGVVFGLVLWILSLDLAQQIDAGAVAGPDAASRLFFWVALTFACAACVTMFTEAWVVRARITQFVGADFGRVLPIVVVPETVVMFALFLAFLGIGALDWAAANSRALSVSAVDSVVLALQIYVVASLAAPVGAIISSGVRDLSGRGFMAAILPAEASIVPVIVALAWAFLQIQTL